MAQVKQSVSNLAAGFLSDANPLEGARPGATIDESNFHLLSDGTRKKRKGLIVEKDRFFGNGELVFGLVDATHPATSSHLWANTSGPTDHLLLVQAARALVLFNANGHHPVEGKDAFEEYRASIFLSYNLLAYDAAYASLNSLEYATGAGLVVCVGDGTEPFYFEYQTSSTALTFESIHPRTRTFTRLDEGDTSPQTRPTALTGAHRFNLLNQGWTTTAITAFQAHANNTRGVYPSNSDIFDKTKDYLTYIATDTRNTLAPNGSLIRTIDVFHELYSQHDEDDWWDKGQVVTAVSKSGASITVTVPATTDFITGEFVWVAHHLQDTSLSAACLLTASTATTLTFTWPYDPADFPTTVVGFKVYPGAIAHPTKLDRNIQRNRFTTCAFYAGRAWYSGIPSSSRGSEVYFSKIVENTGDLGICYQAADPTSLADSAPVSSDGGVLSLPEAGLVHNLVPFKNSLLVLAENGTWVVTGSRGDVFNALSHQVYQLDTTPTYKNKSAVVAGDQLYYWTQSGINVISLGEQGVRLQSRSLTENRLSSFITELGEDTIISVEGRYNPVDNAILWAFRTDSTQYGLDSTLSYRPALNAFYKGDLPSSPLADNIGYTGILPVIANHSDGYQPENTTKFLEVHDLNSGGVDWYIRSYGYDVANKTEPEGFLTTWPTSTSDLSADKQIKYITTYFNVSEKTYETDGNGDLQFTPEGSCTLQGRFDNDTTGTANKWGTVQQVYRLPRMPLLTDPSGTVDFGYSQIVTKNKVRGSGRYIQLHFESPANKDCHILGWEATVDKHLRRR